MALVALPLAVTAFFVVEVAAGLPRMGGSSPDDAAPGRVVLVMPAHDEATIIARTLAPLLPALDGWAELLIVADNCHDDTAVLARAAGATVIERASATDRGKGFALAFAQSHLRQDPPAAVIVLDADCASDRASLMRLAGAALRLGRPCQAVNLIRPNRAGSPMVQLSTFAFMIKNLIRQRGLQRLAGRVHLTGTGMAMPWSLFDGAPLASANVVEDIELGLRLERAGFPPQLISGASVWSDPSDGAGTLVQRTRWEGGFIALATVQAPRQLAAAIARADLRGLAGALDLCIPPLTLLALIDVAAIAVGAAVTALLHLAWWPVALLIMATAAALLLVSLAWLREGRAFITFATLLRVPLYMLWKIPLYLGLARGSPREWLRPGR